MKKRFVLAAILLAVLLIAGLTLLPTEIQAAGEIASGTCGDHLTWVVTGDGVLTISGTGEMYNYNSWDQFAPWENHQKKIASVVIEEGVTQLGSYAFSDCSSLASVTISASVTSIGYSAFSDCSSLTSVSIPDSVTSIGDFAFKNCSSLTSVTILASVTSIGWDAFSGCSSLNFHIYDNAKYLGNEDNPYFVLIEAVSEDITQCEIHNQTKLIADFSFYYCRNLESVTIPASVTSLGAYAFSCCSNLTSIMIPANVTYIGEGAFAYCENLTSIRFLGDPPTVGNDAFYLKCVDPVIYYPEGDTWTNTVMWEISPTATWIAEDRWSLDDNGTLTIFGNGDMMEYLWVDEVPWDAFRSEVKNVIIEDGITSISRYAFYNCDNLVSVTIPASVSSVGDWAFYGCSSLTSVTIPEDVTSIGSYAFTDCAGLTSVTISNSVTSIGGSAFSGCISLTGVTIPDSVTSIGDYAFSSCSGLTSVTVGDGVTSIGYSAFSGCISLTGVTIPNSVTGIGDYAFSSCSSLTNVTIPDSVTSIGKGAFHQCVSLWHVLYKGSEVQWKCILIESTGNAFLQDTTKHYNCTGEEVIDAVNKICTICFANCEHQWDSGIITTQPNCEQEGVKTYTCTVCGCTTEEPVAALGHHYTDMVTAPTCEAQGYTTHTCTVCGASYTTDHMDALGHSYDEGVVTTAPTCAAEGVKIYTCTVCGDTKTETIAKTDVHTYDDGVVTTEPTCTEQGEMTYTCVHCGHSYTEAVPAVPHNFVDGVCADCGAPEVELGDANGDGKINARDARALLRYIAGLDDGSEISNAAADFNGDGRINARDARAILRYIAGLE